MAVRVKQLLQIPVLLVLCQILYGAVGQQCTPEKVETSILGMMLRRHIYKRITGVEYGHVCLLDCYQDVRCQSFNYVISQYMCELNNRTKEARPEDYVPDSDRYYFGREMNRVPLGSIPELPAETCKEIKASEGGQAITQEYWFDSIIPGETVLAYCDMKKEDVDECSASMPVCDVNANCKNTRGSYRCSCKSGFTGSGKKCADIDECSASLPVCDVNANCQNTVGSYVCSCKAGFTGDGKTCADINECSTSVKVCDVNANCQNTPGSYRCSCKAGFSGDGRKTCADIDECSASISVCDVNANCQNTGGSYVCSCNAGFTGDGRTCVDIDECLASIPVCDANANCQNTRGSYVCSCKAGFTGDGKTCTDVNECSASIRVCDANANCQNTGGSYVCSCITGFTGDGKTCSDIDECVSGVHHCHSSASCTNTVGSYSFSCIPPYTGDGKTCTHPVPECQNYASLTSADRKITYSNNSTIVCDRHLGPGWFRFQGAAGTRMPTSCPPSWRCSTHATGWLNGEHPAVADGQVTRQVCFHWSSNCCLVSTNINVTNCGSFYVYYLKKLRSWCHRRYCGTD